MMNDIKRTFSLIKYGDQFLANMIIAVSWLVFAILGLVLIGISAGELEINQAFAVFLLMPPLVMIQCVFSLEATGLMASSGKRRLISIKGQNFLTVGGIGVLYLLIILCVSIQYVLSGNKVEGAGEFVLNLGIFAFLLLIYASVVHKTFLVGVLLFGVGYGIYGILSSYIIHRDPSFGVGLTIGVLIFILGAVLSCLIRTALYKKPVSKTALGAEMRKYM